MIEEADIVPTLEKVLADQALFLSKVQGITPGSMTRAEIKEMEQEILEAFQLTKELIVSIGEQHPDPAIIDDRLKRAIVNITAILETLTPLYKQAPE